MRRILLVLLVAILPIDAFGAQLPVLPQDLAVRVWNKQQGLPDDSVTSLLQTHDGYLWIGTAGGLVRFDGVRFVPMSPYTLRSNAVISITALCEDSSGRLWVGTQGDGLLCYANGTLRRFHGKGVRLDETINSVAEDAAGDIWIGMPGGLARLASGQITRFTARDGLPNDFVSSVHVARSGTVWITTRAGMCQFKNGRIYPYVFQTDSPSRSPEYLGIYEDRQGNLWAFGDTYLVNLKDRKYLNHFGSGDLTSSTRIWSLCEGRRGELWIGTSGKGLYCFVDNQFLPVTLRSGGLTSDVRALCEDREGNLWLGTHGGGVVRLQPRNMRWLEMDAGLPNRPATCLAFGAEGRAWIGFERDGLFTGEETFQRPPAPTGWEFQSLVSSVATAADGSLWVGTPGAGLYRISNKNTAHFTTANGLADNRVLAVASDADGAVWAGTAAGTLHRFKSGWPASFGLDAGLPAEPVTTLLATGKNLWIGFETGELGEFSNKTFRTTLNAGSLGGKSIRSLYLDAAGRLWIGTAGGLLGCWTKGHLVSWNLNLSAPEYAILGILSDEEGNLWLSTSSAVYHLAQNEIADALAGRTPLRPQMLYKGEVALGPLPHYGWPRAMKAPDGKLWFALATGIAVFDLRAPLAGLTPPPVLIEKIVVDKQTVCAIPSAHPNLPHEKSEPARFPSDMGKLEIHFTALNFSAPEKTRFRYRLEGYESDWVTSDSIRAVSYGKLPYGPHRFRVQAGLEGGSWFNNEASFSFVIPIPFWRTGFAVTIYMIVAIVLIGGAARMVSNRILRRRLAALAAQQAMERERMRIAQDMHDEIGSKLTKISFMSERAMGELQGHEPVAKRLDSIARTTRDLLQSLDEIVWAVNPHNDTLEHLAAYLGQYATEYLQNTSVECELRIARGLPNYPLSAEARHNLFLAFEESLNNALKHGRPSRIQIDMTVEGKHFIMRIEDNGCGFDSDEAFSQPRPPGQRGGYGLRNMRERLAAVGGQFDLMSHPGKGTVVSFSVPLTAKAILMRKK
ncbi:MAG TPA: two-component regulator propeller domain-containing protein [Verrucomicrobiae bacterium]|nr:two-component regulator propeller domain-containing protein [Verrucomicrobiae bacterium]